MCSAEGLLIRTQESAKRHCGCPRPAFVEAFWIAKQNRSRKPYSLKSASAGVLRKIELVRASYVCHVSSSDKHFQTHYTNLYNRLRKQLQMLRT